MERRTEAVKYIISRIIAGERNLRKLKNEAGKKFALNEIPKNTELWTMFPKSKLTDEIKLLLLRKPVRTISGVSPIAVMIRPEGSCRFRCIYCPFTGKAAKSYTGEEPAALRARQNNFDPGKQVKTRLEQFRIGGHPNEKCEIIIMGGTFLQMERKYKYGFIKSVYDALNSDGKSGKKTLPSKDLETAKKMNETAKHRAIGLTIETRPDICKESEINEMLEFGATRVELGVQNPNDRIYRNINRGHTVKDVEIATRLLKDSSFKVLYHIMPGLPGSSPSEDIRMVKKMFGNERFKPDMLKIYPTLVMPNTELFKMYENGEYEPYTTEQAADVISEFFKYIPKYVRVMRIQRDIPTGLIVGGVNKSNLRELVEAKIREKR
ncbi:MAG: tRNA uridine(34) 5-carboxymethylaminomethyl modification radical SAM/GNAT enzyme Elp3, partial [Candidatus Micrarchaeia archaeon]